MNSTYIENAQLRKIVEQKGKYVIELNNDLKQFKNRAKQLIKLEDTIIALVAENKSLREVGGGGFKKLNFYFFLNLG